MRTIILILFFMVVAMTVHAEVFMYQDSAGKWHGVNQINDVPAEYRSQCKETIQQAEIKSQEEEMAETAKQRWLKEKNEKEFAPEKIQVLLHAREAAINTMYEKIEEKIKDKIGTRLPDGAVITDYKIVTRDFETIAVVGGEDALKTVVKAKFNATKYGHTPTEFVTKWIARKHVNKPIEIEVPSF